MDEQFTTTWMTRLKAGDSLAAQQVWQDYYERLLRLARRKLAGRVSAITDEEDVVAAAFHSFFRGVEQQRFPRLDDRDDLWQLLVMLTARKAADQLQYENRKKRGEGKVQGESVLDQNDSAVWGINQVVGAEPTPEFAVQMTEQIQRLLDRLGEKTLQNIALMKLEGYSNQEIANQANCGLRTVERKLTLIRAIWHDEPKHES